MLKNTTKRYGKVSVLLHWLMALMLVSLFGIGLYMTDLGYYDSLYHILPWWHKSFGLLILALLLARMLWSFINPKPQPPETHKHWEKKAAAISHPLLYALTLLICASGYFISTSGGAGIEFFGWFDVPAITQLSAENTDLAGDIHFYLAWGLIVLAAVHALAALKHHFIDRDNTLINMTLGKK
ncbi:cytochrome b [Leucothrix sargassi]|nr:cytochrome b [Leucothrix sargassi]